jgi:hypothetical protein
MSHIFNYGAIILLFQKLTSEVVTKHELLEKLNEHCAELLENKQEKNAVNIKNEVCRLNDRWDEMYEELKFREKSAQSILMLWYSYRDKMRSMNEFLDNLKVQIHEQQSVCKDEKELNENIKKVEVSQFLRTFVFIFVLYTF